MTFAGLKPVAAVAKYPDRVIDSQAALIVSYKSDVEASCNRARRKGSPVPNRALEKTEQKRF
jgi:hypothetical protein